MVLRLVAHRVPRSGLGARRQTGRSPANSSGTVLLPYPRSLPQDASFSSSLRSTASLARARAPGLRASGTAARMLPAHLPNLRTYGDARRNASVAGIADIRRLSEQRESNLAPRGGRYI